jgi:hypothetical protein
MHKLFWVYFLNFYTFRAFQSNQDNRSKENNKYKLLCTYSCRLRLKCDGTRAATIFRLSAKSTSPFKSVGTSFQSTTGSRGVRISGSNAVYTMFRGSVKGTGYPLHSPVSFSLPLPCVTVCHHISNGLYLLMMGLDTPETYRDWRNILRISYASSWFFFTRMFRCIYLIFRE